LSGRYVDVGFHAPKEIANGLANGLDKSGPEAAADAVFGPK